MFEKLIEAARTCYESGNPIDECCIEGCPNFDSQPYCLDQILKDCVEALTQSGAELKDKDYLIQQQTDDIRQLRHDVQVQQDKILELYKCLYKTGVFAADGREIMKGDKVRGLFWLNSEITGTVIFRDGSFGLEWDRGGALEFTPFTSTCNVQWEVVE